MRKQKVLIVHNYYQIPGGEDTVVENEKNMLLENGHEVVLYTRHNDEIKLRGILGKIMLPFETIFSFKTYREVKRKIKEDNIDIVHVHNTFPLISPSVYYAAKNCNISVIQTIHNFRVLCPGATFTRNNNICEECVEKSLICAVKNKCYRDSVVQSIVSASSLTFHRLIGTYSKVDGYIALTKFNKEKLKKIVSENKIYVKPNFVKKIEHKGIINRRSYFLFLGRIDELKGIKLLVESWKDINNSKLLVVGKGPLEEEIKEYIKNNNIKDIELLGFKQRDEVMELIRGAKALIVPSQWYEGFPMTIAESLSQGIPVIAGDIGNLSTIVEDRKNGLLFKYDNKDQLKEKVLQIENDDKLLKVISNGATNSFNEKYTEDINYKLLVNIYSKCSRRS